MLSLMDFIDWVSNVTRTQIKIESILVASRSLCCGPFSVIPSPESLYFSLCLGRFNLACVWTLNGLIHSVSFVCGLFSHSVLFVDSSVLHLVHSFHLNVLQVTKGIHSAGDVRLFLGFGSYGGLMNVLMSVFSKHVCVRTFLSETRVIGVCSLSFGR